MNYIYFPPILGRTVTSNGSPYAVLSLCLSDGICVLLTYLFFYYSRQRIASAIAEDYYVFVVLFSFFNFFRPLNVRRPWADFRKTLPHDAVCAEIVYFL